MAKLSMDMRRGNLAEQYLVVIDDHDVRARINTYINLLKIHIPLEKYLCTHFF
jgi:hypothetical protein